MKMTIDEFKNLTKKGSKYHNEKTEYKGEKYDSKKEADYAKSLDTFRKARHASDRVVNWDRQVKYPVSVNGGKICTYIADFIVEYADKHKEIVDVKGYKTEVYKIKKRLVESIYKIKIIEI